MLQRRIAGKELTGVGKVRLVFILSLRFRCPHYISTIVGRVKSVTDNQNRAERATELGADKDAGMVRRGFRDPFFLSSISGLLAELRFPFGNGSIKGTNRIGSRLV